MSAAQRQLILQNVQTKAFQNAALHNQADAMSQLNQYYAGTTNSVAYTAASLLNGG